MSPSSAPSLSFLRRPRWNPYVVGAAIGVLSWIVFAVVDKPLGVTTSLTGLAGACAAPFVGADTVAANAYFKQHVFKWDYGMLFLGGIALGGFLSALASGSFRAETVPSVWRERFGPSAPKRFFAAFLGGLLAMFGARLADGCTSGNGISGSLQLAVGGWTFFLTLFAFGILTSLVLFGRGRTVKN
ncbi:MAG: YeeE/YedE thiosulfate transporter family protein [Verrucomicrobia bacterium]|nr:YeeE/YedE thiosulfate transporter family protein [Verrucomicrobiota bacterium]